MGFVFLSLSFCFVIWFLMVLVQLVFLFYWFLLILLRIFFIKGFKLDFVIKRWKLLVFSCMSLSLWWGLREDEDHPNLFYIYLAFSLWVPFLLNFASHFFFLYLFLSVYLILDSLFYFTMFNYSYLEYTYTLFFYCRGQTFL